MPDKWELQGQRCRAFIQKQGRKQPDFLWRVQGFVFGAEIFVLKSQKKRTVVTEQFKVYTAEDGKILSSEIVDTNGSGHGALAGFLKNLGVEVLICGGIGGGARNALAEAGIRLFPGACGNADAQAEAFLAGSLNYNPDTMCNHHHHEGEGCHGHGEEGHTCGGHCVK